MAHRTDVIQVHQDFPESTDRDRKVTDPNCGMRLSPREAKHMLFRGENTHYFCSRECEEEFIRAKHKKAA